LEKAMSDNKKFEVAASSPCNKTKRGSEYLADLLFAPESASAATRAHVESCAACSRELAELRSTMMLMEEWSAPGPSAYFDTKLLARLRSEQSAPPAGWWERVRARILFGPNMHLRPIAAGVMAVILLAGGGTFAGITMLHKTAPAESATVNDLQNLDGNAQVFQQLDTLDQNDDDPGPTNSNL
jgi:hypothetical protein